MLRLLYITPGYAPVAHQRGRYLSENGWEVHQVTSRQQYTAATHRLPLSTSGSHHIHLTPIWRVGDPHKGLLQTLLPWVRQLQPAVIALERDPDTLLAWQVALIRRLFAPRAKLVFHSWQNVARPLSRPVRFVLNQTLRAADGIICANAAGEGILRQWGYHGSTPLQPWMGVDTTTFYPRSQEAADLRREMGLETVVVAGYVGRLAPEKGLDDLLHALFHTPTNLHLLFIGQGEQETHLRQLTHQLGLSQRVRFVGSVPHAHLPGYMSLLDMLVLPSRSTTVWQEQFGRVLIEAMACGAPLVGSSSGAIPEVIGSAGLIFPEGDTVALAQTLTQLVNSPSLRQELAAHGRQRIDTTYSQPIVSQRVAALYQQLATAP